MELLRYACILFYILNLLMETMINQLVWIQNFILTCAILGTVTESCKSKPVEESWKRNLLMTSSPMKPKCWHRHVDHASLQRRQNRSETALWKTSDRQLLKAPQHWPSSHNRGRNGNISITPQLLPWSKAWLHLFTPKPPTPPSLSLTIIIHVQNLLPIRP